MWNNDLQADYEALQSGQGYAPLADHFVVQLSGADRHAFLHNFCTADTKKLPHGHATEAFILNPKGKTLAFVNVLAFEDVMWLIAAGRDHAAKVIEHLDRYLIREDVQLLDISNSVSQFFTRGDALVQAIGLTTQASNECGVSADLSLRTAHIEIAGLGHWFACPADDESSVVQTLGEANATSCRSEALQSVRLEQQTPWSGTEADETNLPQELQRDEKAISFDKGCYLGQETVARLDALGRVNQLLVSVTFGSEIESVRPSGGKLSAEDKSAGRVTSVAWSPQANAHIGLAFVRRAFTKPETRLTFTDDSTANDVTVTVN